MRQMDVPCTGSVVVDAESFVLWCVNTRLEKGLQSTFKTIIILPAEDPKTVFGSLLSHIKLHPRD